MTPPARPGRPPADDPRTEDIRIRCTPSEKAAMSAAAAAAGQPLARWVRDIALSIASSSEH